VATVNQDGLVTAVAAGTATIRAKALDGSGVVGTASVTVTNPPVPVSGITLDRAHLNLTVGASFQLTATIAPDNADNQGVLWSAADTAVAGVSQNGLVSALAAGTTTITAKAAGDQTKTAQATVNVTGSAYVPATGLTLNPSGPLSLKAGDPAKIIAPTVTPANASNKAVSWESSQPAVATVAQVGQNGYVTAVSAGTTHITAKALGGSNVSATITVTVAQDGTPAPFVGVETISASPPSLTMKPGETKTIQTSLSPEDATNTEVAWESNNPAVATVKANAANVSAAAADSSAGAVVTAVSAGRAVVTATALGGNNVKVAIPVTVESDAPPVQIPTLPPGDITVDFIGSPVPAGGLPFTTSVRATAPVANAILLVTYPDGSVHFCETRVEGATLVFTFTPPAAGTYLLDFTLIDAEGKLSEPSLTLVVPGSSTTSPPPSAPSTPPPASPPTTTKPGTSQGGGGGCNGGMGALSALLLAGLFLYRRR
jgi:Synergist-CTERM protein sorting domain-containing protein